MDWIQEHLQLVILIAGAVAYWINQTRKGWAESGEEDMHTPRQPHAPLAPGEPVDNDEQVRRIQAEIRRKIAERRAASGAPAPVFEAPPLPPVPQYREERQPLPEPPPLYSRTDDADSMNRQRRLADQLAEAERAKAAARERLEHVWDRPNVVAARRKAATNAPGHLLSPRETLRDRAAIKRAWIMREVLEKPVGLR